MVFDIITAFCYSFLFEELIFLVYKVFLIPELHLLGCELESKIISSHVDCSPSRLNKIDIF